MSFVVFVHENALPWGAVFFLFVVGYFNLFDRPLPGSFFRVFSIFLRDLRKFRAILYIGVFW